MGVKRGQTFIFELLKLVVYINLTQKNQLKKKPLEPELLSHAFLHM